MLPNAISVSSTTTTLPKLSPFQFTSYHQVYTDLLSDNHPIHQFDNSPLWSPFSFFILLHPISRNQNHHLLGVSWMQSTDISKKKKKQKDFWVDGLRKNILINQNTSSKIFFFQSENILEVVQNEETYKLRM